MKKNITSKLIAGAAVVAVAGAYVAPLTANAAVNTVINSQVNSVVSLFTSSGTVNIDVIPTASGAQTIARDTVTVSTNANGYTLQLANQDSNTALVSGSNTIAAASGTQSAPSALTSGQWGYRVDGLGAFGSGPTQAVSSQPIGSLTFAGVPAAGSAATLKDTNTAATNDTTSVWYSVAASTSQASGTYTDTVTYTATAKP